MASVLANGSTQLSVAMFGQKITFTSSDGVVTCTSGTLTEPPASMKALFQSAIDWITSDPPRTMTLFGPAFTQTFKFFDTYGQPTCYAVHGDTLGVREDRAAFLAVMQVAVAWLTDHGV